MNKERELLERILVSGIFDSNLFEDWEQYIQELLAQPEGITPREGLTEYKKGYAKAEFDLKREPLGLEIMDVCGSEDYREGFKDGALYAEKCHDIGGGE